MKRLFYIIRRAYRQDPALFYLLVFPFCFVLSVRQFHRDFMAEMRKAVWAHLVTATQLHLEN